MTPQQEIVSRLIKKFPNAAANTLAKRAYKDNPEAFASINSANLAVRRALGVHGNIHRKSMADKSQFRKPRKAGIGFAAIPKGKTHFEKWGAYLVDGKRLALVISDLHIPYHNDI